MIISNHVKISGVLGLGVYACTSEFVPSVACFLGGWLIDIDHLLDWVMNFGPTPNYTRVKDNFARNRVRYVYVIFHGWEYPIGILTFHAFYGLPQWVVYATVGYICHLTLDQMFNCHKGFLTYFLTYRILHKFKASSILVRQPGTAPVYTKNTAMRADEH
ncbi:MAG: hypothetical protein V3V45_07610 [Candidatus Brocadiales bacterium]